MPTEKITTSLIICALVMGSILPAIGCGGSITGSSDIVTKEMDYSNFTKLEISNAFEVDVSRGDAYFVSITANDNLFQHLDVRQSGKTLYIGLKQPRLYVRTTQKAAIVMPELQRLNLSGASRGKASDFSADAPIDFELSGASSLNIDGLEAGNAEFDISGASSVSGHIKTADCSFTISGASFVELAGSANDIYSEASGASKLQLSDFSVHNAKVDLSGASKATINASGRLDGKLSGASELSYLGNPTLGDLQTSGGSKVSRK